MVLGESEAELFISRHLVFGRCRAAVRGDHVKIEFQILFEIGNWFKARIRRVDSLGGGLRKGAGEEARARADASSARARCLEIDVPRRVRLRAGFGTACSLVAGQLYSAQLCSQSLSLRTSLSSP